MQSLVKMSELNTNSKEQSTVTVLVHSFFVIPFIIAVFGVLFFFMWKILADESDSAQDYLNEIKVGSATKRWQSAFELAKILGNPELVPKNDKFVNELKMVYRNSIHDDPQVRTYLALAMGATGSSVYGEVLLEGLSDENIQSKISSMKALGQIKYKESIPLIRPFLEKSIADDLRLTSVMSLGMMKDTTTIKDFLPLLDDEEANIRWESAVALGKLKDERAIPIIKELLQRDYLMKFSQVDDWEQVQAILVAIHIAGILQSEEFIPYLEKLALSDMNMKIRDSAIKTLKYTYNKDLK